MGTFKGFASHPQHLVSVPLEFFTELLPKIENGDTIKIILYAFRNIAESESQFPFLSLSNMKNDNIILRSFGSNPQEQGERLLQSLDEACVLEALLKAPSTSRDSSDTLYFINSPRGRAAIEAIQNGTFRYNPNEANPIQPQASPANIFSLYEENIGPITPILAETLTDLEKQFSAEWIAEAFQEAAKSNVRNLRYIEAILKNWQEAGKHVRTNRRSSQKTTEEHDPERYTGGEFSEFIDH
ncbi:DnaD domain protein [bacterium]|nr:DnaD domain protein [bacterium]